ncbi:MAG: VCBS repeat-containing protein [Chloroflexi bacterium]|nr:VCBS repeat-containing protein [Chloroflexota bacterium]
MALAALLVAAGGAFHQPVHDLATDPAGLTVQGVHTVDQLGWIVASGDFNGDGNADLLVTARLADPGGAGNEGAAYVIFGPRSGVIDLAQCPGDPNHCADVVIEGADGSDQLGFSAAAADFNGDSYDDILVASYQADGPGTGTCVNQNGAFRGTGDRCSAGEAYIIFGSPLLGGIIDTAAGEQDVTILGASAGDEMGVASGAGDVNGDGYDDILLGAHHAGPGGKAEAGEAYVVFGSATLAGTVDLATATDIAIVQGEKAGDLLGGAVGSGDISGDGVADFLLGAHFADPLGRGTAGAVYGVYLPQIGALDLATTAADLTVYGAEAGDVLGLRESGLDFNGDGQDDLYLDARFGDGAGNGSANAGEAYIIFGPKSGTIDLAVTNPDFTIFGADADDSLRASLDAGDFNGDGVDDLVASSFFADAAGSGTACGTGQVGDRCQAGETYIVFGPRTGILDLATASADRTVLGAQAGDNLGRWLSAGDFDGDGVDDLLVGAIGADPGGRADAGEAYVLIGGNTSTGIGLCVSLNGGLSAIGGVEVCYSSVLVAGHTIVTISETGPPPPTGFRIVGLPGSASVYYDIDTTAEFDGSVSVCIRYDGSLLKNSKRESRLKHQQLQGGFEDVTDSVDTVNDIVCGTTTSLSLFAVMEPIAVGGIVELVSVSPDSSRRQAAGADPSAVRDIALAGGLAAVVALAAGGWYARRRLS